MATDTVSYGEEWISTEQVDIAHTDRIGLFEHRVARDMAESFLRDMSRYFKETYMHLDVEKTPERKHGIQGLRWRALLTTDRGRYYAENGGFGVEHALSNTLESLENQITSRLEKLNG